MRVAFADARPIEDAPGSNLSSLRDWRHSARTMREMQPMIVSDAAAQRVPPCRLDHPQLQPVGRAVRLCREPAARHRRLYQHRAARRAGGRFLDFLNRFITDLSLAIAEAGGEIHKYVGDEIIATWTLAAGLNEAACVRACFAALDRLAARGPAYERDFGCRADFRAGLHCGSVVVGELGYLKKEIALIGDSMNTAARIQEACRGTGCRVLASAALIERIGALPVGVMGRSLGPLLMRGKEQPIALCALETVDRAE